MWYCHRCGAGSPDHCACRFGHATKEQQARMDGYDSRQSEIDRLASENAIIYAALEDLVRRCDGPEGIMMDGSNIDTAQASAALMEAR